MKLAVIAHTDKRMGKAQPADLRAALADAGIPDPMWFEVAKSMLAPYGSAEPRRPSSDPSRPLAQSATNARPQRSSNTMSDNGRRATGPKRPRGQPIGRMA